MHNIYQHIQYDIAQIQHRQFYHTFYSVHIQFATAANQPRQFSYVTQTILLSHFLHQISQDNFTVMPRQFYYATCFKQYTICHCDLLAQTICHWYVSCIYNYTLVPRQLYTGTQTIIHCCLDNFPVLIIQPRQFYILDNFTTLPLDQMLANWNLKPNSLVNFSNYTVVQLNSEMFCFECFERRNQ